MNAYNAVVVCNIAVVVCVVLVALITGSPISLLGLFFMCGVKKTDKDSELEPED